MSKRLDMLNAVESQRTNKYSTALTKNAPSKHHTGWIMAIILVILLILNFGVHFSERNDSMAKLEKIEKLLNDNARQMNVFLSDTKQMDTNLKSVSLKIKDINSDIEQIEETDDINAVAITNLTKAKNTLFKELSQLRAEFEQLKKATSQEGGA